MNCVCVFTWSDAAAWVGAIASTGAIWAGVWIYQRTKRDEQNRLDARRRVLAEMVNDHLRHVLYRTARILLTFKHSEHDYSPGASGIMAAQMKDPDIERLSELQGMLINFGTTGDIEIARFIERCRYNFALIDTYRERLKECCEMQQERNIDIPDLKNDLQELFVIGKALLTRLDPTQLRELMDYEKELGPIVPEPVTSTTR